MSSDSVAREWRCRFVPAKDDGPLRSAMTLLSQYKPTIRSIPGFRSVNYSICRVKHELKVLITVDEAAYEPWERDGFAPEAKYSAELSKLAGISQVETQSFLTGVA